MIKHLSVIAALLALFLALPLQKALAKDQDKIIRITGTLIFLNFEGGFCGIIADDGTRYDPTGFSKDLCVEGTRVRVRAKLLKDTASIHLWGQSIKIIRIKKIISSSNRGHP